LDTTTPSSTTPSWFGGATLPEYLSYIRVVRLPNCLVPLPLKLRLTSQDVLVVEGLALAEAMSLPTT
jgi:hypothetical protein